MATYSELIGELHGDLEKCILHKRRMSGGEFERRLYAALAAKYPFCFLPNVVLYRPDHFRSDPADRGELAYEIDNLFHYRAEGIDHIIILESKAQPIRISEEDWYVEYTGKEGASPKRKSIRKQLIGHAETVLRYLRPLNRNVELRIEAAVVSSDNATRPMVKRVSDKVRIAMVSYQQMENYIETLLRLKSGGHSTILRVAQSEFLALLRLGIPVSALGHPEPRHAIQYNERCKREIDRELFRSFAPKKNRWAINGTAGTGKSVLLAYSTAVFASGREIVDSSGSLALGSFEARGSEKGMPALATRTIHVLAMKPKQCQVLEELYARFVRNFLELSETDLPFLKPAFGVWSDTEGVPKGCNVLLLDESHDLSSAGQDAVRVWHESSPLHYLALACDRHQKIRLVGHTATILQGLSFSGVTTRLSRNYRNPFPIYAVALSLMFRWMGDGGPKIALEKRELEDFLGSDLEVSDAPGGGLTLSMMSDVHPANGWSHCVETFDQCASAYAHLCQQNLNRAEVLWVRFSKEDPDFDYEKLSAFTYHNFFTAESSDLVDKYVKGQEFPIVVIEGFPDHMDEWGKWDPHLESMDEIERKMWSFRRELYLCASRATAFLYFICNTTETPAVQRIEGEMGRLIQAFSLPQDPSQTHALQWRFTILPTSMKRSADVFVDLAASAKPEIPITDPIVVKEFAAKLGVKPFQLIHHLMEINVFTSANQTLERSVAVKVAKKLGFEIIFTKNGP